MRSYLTLICCIGLISQGAATSQATASLQITSSSGVGGSHITAHQKSSAVGPRATAVVGTSGSASTTNSHANVDSQSLSNSDNRGGRTDTHVNTDAQTSGNGKAHVTGDAIAANQGSGSAANHQAVVESSRGGAADAIGGVSVSSDRRGSNALFTNAGGSRGPGSAVIKSEAAGENNRGKVLVNQDLAAGSTVGGSSDAQAALEAGFNHKASQLLSILRGETRGEAAIVLGNEGAAVGPNGVSAGKSRLEAQSAGHFHGRRRNNRFMNNRLLGNRPITSSSFGEISAGTLGGVHDSDTTASADGEVVRDGTVAAMAEFGSQGGNFHDTSVKASLVIDAVEPQKRNNRRKNRRQSNFRRNNRMNKRFRL